LAKKTKKRNVQKQQFRSKQPGKQESKITQTRRISRPVVAIGIVALLIIVSVFAFDFENGEIKLAFMQGKVIDNSNLPDNTPRLSVEQDEIDFGTLKHNTRKTFTFEVTNTGNDVLEFERPPKIKVVKGC